MGCGARAHVSSGLTSWQRFTTLKTWEHFHTGPCSCCPLMPFPLSGEMGSAELSSLQELGSCAERGHGTKQLLPAEGPVLEFLQPPASRSSSIITCRKSLREQGERHLGGRPCAVPMLLSLGQLRAATARPGAGARPRCPVSAAPHPHTHPGPRLVGLQLGSALVAYLSPYSPFVAIPTATSYRCDQAGTTQGRFLGCNGGAGLRARHGAAARELWQSLAPLPGHTVLAQAGSKAPPGSCCCCVAHHSPFPIHPPVTGGDWPVPGAEGRAVQGEAARCS